MLIDGDLSHRADWTGREMDNQETESVEAEAGIQGLLNQMGLRKVASITRS